MAKQSTGPVLYARIYRSAEEERRGEERIDTGQETGLDYFGVGAGRASGRIVIMIGTKKKGGGG